MYLLLEGYCFMGTNGSARHKYSYFTNMGGRVGI